MSLPPLPPRPPAIPAPLGPLGPAGPAGLPAPAGSSAKISEAQRSVLRMIDANLNRACEGLRTCEDIARFLLDDADLASTMKTLRHQLTQTVMEACGNDRLVLLESRDSAGDVGLSMAASLAQVPKRELLQIIPAAAQRTQQALRVLEETLGLVSPHAARLGKQIESLRYMAYTADKSLGARVSALMDAQAFARGVQWKLCVLITESLCKRSWHEVAHKVMEAGADCIQLREKDLSDRELLARAAWLVRKASEHPHQPAIIINDRADIALLSGADGVHLGQDDLSPAEVRSMERAWRGEARRSSRPFRIGLSTHDLAELDAAMQQPIDYVGIGAMFPTTTKPRATSGPVFLQDALNRLASTAAERAVSIGHLAIGGITPRNIAELRQVGCGGIAVSSFVCQVDDPHSACLALMAG